MSSGREEKAGNSAGDKREDNVGGLKIAAGTVVSVNISPKKSVRKKPVGEALMIEDYGLEGDAHAGPGLKQVSLLALESIEKMKRLGLEVVPGDFAENLTTSGLNPLALPVGTILEVGDEVVLEITRHGKTCHTKCAIFRQVGHCVMPEEGVFARVIKGGKIKAGDGINVRTAW
ncbi:MAG: MOSC domain-containing protein [Candidatus Saccharicenans sp.]|nr:MOSC domain-containing protein [Candidatus Saccharicenans sp.]